MRSTATRTAPAAPPGASRARRSSRGNPSRPDQFHTLLRSQRSVAHGRVPEKPGVLVRLRVKRDEVGTLDVDPLEPLSARTALRSGRRGIASADSPRARYPMIRADGWELADRDRRARRADSLHNRAWTEAASAEDIPRTAKDGSSGVVHGSGQGSDPDTRPDRRSIRRIESVVAPPLMKPPPSRIVEPKTSPTARLRADGSRRAERATWPRIAPGGDTVGETVGARATNAAAAAVGDAVAGVTAAAGPDGETCPQAATAGTIPGRAANSPFSRPNRTRARGSRWPRARGGRPATWRMSPADLHRNHRHPKVAQASGRPDSAGDSRTLWIAFRPTDGGTARREPSPLRSSMADQRLEPWSSSTPPR